MGNKSSYRPVKQCDDHVCGYKHKDISSLSHYKTYWKWDIWRNVNWKNYKRHNDKSKGDFEYLRYVWMLGVYRRELKHLKYLSCTNLKGNDEDFCCDCQELCKVRFCERLSNSDSDYCNIHTCTVKGCKEKTTIKSNYQLFSDHPHCEKHQKNKI